MEKARILFHHRSYLLFCLVSIVTLSGCGTVLPIIGSNSVAAFPPSVHAVINDGVTVPCATGCSFTTYTMANGLPSNNVTSVFAVGSTIYVGTDQGVAYTTNPATSWTVLNHTTNGLVSNSVTNLYVVPDTPTNDLYVATPSGLSMALQATGASTFSNSTSFSNGLGCGSTPVANSVVVGPFV